MPSPNLLSRSGSMSDFSAYQEEWETPPETLTLFDLLDNLALPTRLEKWQLTLTAQKESPTAAGEDQVLNLSGKGQSR